MPIVPKRPDNELVRRKAPPKSAPTIAREQEVGMTSQFLKDRGIAAPSINQINAQLAFNRTNPPGGTPPPTPPGGGGGVSFRRGGGGGGGAPAFNNQAALDFLTSALSRANYTATPSTGLQTQVNSAAAKDQAALTAAYDAYDQYLQGHQTNPYANVQLQRAQQAPDMSQYMGTQGVQPLVQNATNPEDTGYGAFQNVLALLSAGQLASNESRMGESRAARTFGQQQIGAAENAFLFNIAQQNEARQQTLDDQRRQAILQLAELVGGGGVPNLATLGLA